MIDETQAQTILIKRMEHEANDKPEFQIKRNRFLDWLSVNYFQDNLRVLEMHRIGESIVKSRYEKYNFFNPLHNVRTKINSETCLEIDKLNFEKTIALMIEIIFSLIRNNIHFVVFYAEGQRSPHIRIYDFEELNELNPQQRIKAQILFWRKHVPFGCFQYIDSGVFVDEHELQLEFSPHYKYGTMFELLFEYVPGENKNDLKTTNL